MALSLKLAAAAVVPFVLCTGPVSNFLSAAVVSLRNKLLWRYFLFQLFRLWKLPAGPELQHQGRNLLILGSSVAKGEGAEAGPAPNLGWPQRLERALHDHAGAAWKLHIRAVEWTSSQLWYELVMRKTTPEDWKHFSVVILSLSVNNEGFLLTEDEEKMNQIQEHFLKHMRLTVTELRQRLAPDARLVLAGCYANDGYTMKHLEIVKHINQQMSQWPEVHFVNLLQEHVSDLKGHWPSGFSRDPGHPNSLGHEGLFKCLDLQTVLGDFW